MADHRLTFLLSQYANEQITPSEMTELQKLVNDIDDKRMEESLWYFWESDNVSKRLSEDKSDQILSKILDVPSDERENKGKGRLRQLWWLAAASALFALVLTYQFWFKDYRHGNNANAPVVQDIVIVPTPNTNKATITTANGTLIYLDSANNGSLAVQGNVKLVKLANGKVAYENEGGNGDHKLQYNTLSNPRGSRVIDMALSDGTRVWLNAGSSITFPVAFTGTERRVELKGEGYFEVAKNPSKKFIVRSGDVETEVFGTHFNVNAYQDENDLRVTLLEGRVKVSSLAKNKANNFNFLSPNQQAMLDGSSSIRILKNVDVEQVMAWKNGLFNFQNVPIQVAMKQLERWYDIEVEYDGGTIPDILLQGKMTKGVSLNGLIVILQKIGLNCKLVGKRIIVEK